MPLYTKELGLEILYYIGIYNITIAILSLMQFGLNPYIMRQAALVITNLRSNFFLINIIEKSALILIIIIILIFGASFLFGDAYNTNKIIYLLILIFSLIKIHQGLMINTLYGFEEHVFENKLMISQSILQYLGAAGLLFFTKIGIIEIFIWYIIVYFVTSYYRYLFICKKLNIQKFRRRKIALKNYRIHYFELLKYFHGSFKLIILGLIISQSDKIIGYFKLQTNEISIYSAMIMITTGLSALFQPIMTVIFPKLVKLQNSQNNEYNDFISQWLSLIVIVVFIIISLMTIHSRFILELITSSTITNEVNTALKILIPGFGLHVIALFAYYITMVTLSLDRMLKLNYIILVSLIVLYLIFWNELNIIILSFIALTTNFIKHLSIYIVDTKTSVSKIFKIIIKNTLIGLGFGCGISILLNVSASIKLIIITTGIYFIIKIIQKKNWKLLFQ